MTCDGAGAWGSPEACAHLVLTLLGDLGLVVRVEGGLCSQIRMGGRCSGLGCDLGVHGRKRKKQGAVATWEGPPAGGQAWAQLLGCLLAVELWLISPPRLHFHLFIDDNSHPSRGLAERVQ